MAKPYNDIFSKKFHFCCIEGGFGRSGWQSRGLGGRFLGGGGGREGFLIFRTIPGIVFSVAGTENRKPAVGFSGGGTEGGLPRDGFAYI